MNLVKPASSMFKKSLGEEVVHFDSESGAMLSLNDIFGWMENVNNRKSWVHLGRVEGKNIINPHELDVDRGTLDTDGLHEQSPREL